MRSRPGSWTFLAILVVLTVIICSDAMAQRYWKVGFKGGLNTSHLTGDTDSISVVTDELETKATLDESTGGFIGGVDFTYQMSKLFGARLELLYVRNGGSGTFATGSYRSEPIDSAGVEATVTFDYFQIPLLAVFSFGLSERVKVLGVVGPAVALNMKADWEAPEIGAEGGLDNQIGTTEWGFILGAGFEFGFGYRSIVLEGRWTQGLSSVDDSGDELSIKNSSFAILLGVSISG